MDIRVLFLYVSSLLVVLVRCQKDVTEVRMDSTDLSSQCSKIVELRPNQEVQLISKGKAPNGYYSVLISAAGEKAENCSFRYMCVTVKQSSMEFCQAKVHISGKRFEETDSTIEFGCGKSIPSKWCTHAELLEVSVSEKQAYAAKVDSRDYSFNMTVSSECRNFYENLEDDDYVPVDLEEAIHEARILGVIVAVSLASIFLIALAILYLYHRARQETPSRQGQ